MRVCLSCLHTDERNFAYCPSCGSAGSATLARDGALTTIPGSAGLPCQHCFETGQDLAFRRFRQVIAYILAASIQDIAGYFCAGCRGKLFATRQLTNLLLGWWGIVAVAIYNPWAILLNVYALWSAPVGAAEWGALSREDLRAAAQEHEDLDELYASLPTWLTELAEEEIELVFAQTNYYDALEISDSADQAEIKAAYRRLAKRHHPDSADGAGDPERLRALNAAYRVLGDERLRYAYDHAGEIATRLGNGDGRFEGAYEDDPDPQSGAEPSPGFACDICGVVTADLIEATTHLERFHPDIDALRPQDLFTQERS